MDDKIQAFVKPREAGHVVVKPIQRDNKVRLLPIEGDVVPLTGADGRYWRKLIKQGDVIVIKPVAKSAENIPVVEKPKKGDR